MKSQINGEKVKPILEKGLSNNSDEQNGNCSSKEIGKLKKSMKNDAEFGGHIDDDEIQALLQVRTPPPSVSKYHSCKVCFEIFRFANGLEDHMNRKTSQIIFHCSRCNQELTFFNRCSLITHLKSTHEVSQPSINDLKFTKIQALPESHFENYEHYNLEEKEKDGEFSSESTSIILNSNASPFKISLIFKTENGNLYLLNESATTTTKTSNDNVPFDPSPSSPKIISTAIATSIDNSINSTFDSSISSDNNSNSTDQDFVVSAKVIQEIEMKSDEENDIKMVLRNKSKSESNYTSISDSGSGSEQLDEVDDDDDDDGDDDMNFRRKTTKGSKFRRRPTPERKQPSRQSSASTNQMNRLTRSLKTNKSKDPSYQQCVHCLVPIPFKSINRHESSCDYNPNSNSSKKFCFSCNKNTKLNQPLFKHGLEHIIAGDQICLFCNNANIQANIQDHLEAVHFSKMKQDTIFPFDCPLDGKKLANMDQLKEDYISHHESVFGDHLCSLCNLSFSSMKFLLIHRSFLHLNENNIVSNIFGCSYCKSNFRSIFKLKKHLFLSHKLKDVTRKHLMSMRKEKSASTTTTTTTSNDSMLKKNSIDIDKEKTDEEKMNGVKEVSLDGNVQKVLEVRTQKNVSSSKARLENGYFNCLKCHCLFGNQDIFYQHMKSSHVCFDEPKDFDLYEIYLQNKTDYWCIECGETFVVKPSFVKHLHLHSNLGEIDEYLDKIGYKKREQDPLKENQCHVCRLQLLDLDEFESHLRSHGQAYLKYVREKRKSMEVLHQLSPAPYPEADIKEAENNIGNKIKRRRQMKAY